MAITTDVGLLATGAVVVPNDRELVSVTGADRIRFLHGLVTGNVAGAGVGHGCRAALLTPKGQVVSDMWILVRAEDVRVVGDAGQAAPVAAALGRYAIMDDVTAAPAPDFAFLTVLGPAASQRLTAAGVALGALAAAPPLAHADVHAEVGELWAVRVHQLGAEGFWLGGPAAAIAALRTRLDAADVLALDDGAAEAARIAAVEPRFGAEITADYFPMEVGLGGAIDYGKGCYLGQEPIVRVRDRGHINWRLCGLEIVGGVDPRPGDALATDARPKAGKITSAARLPDGRGVALGMVHVSIPIGAVVRAGGVEARVLAEA